MTASRGILRPRKYWSAPDLKRLAELYPTTSNVEIARLLERSIASIYGTAKKLGVKKTAEFLRVNCRLQRGHAIGKSHQFKKGLIPANKGLRRPGWHVGRMKETQFKKGGRPHTWKPIGTILADHEGYLRIKIRDRTDGDAAGWNRQIWPLLHHQVWERHKGPIPAKHLVVFKDGNRNNCAFENLELISKAENARRNRMWVRLPRELGRGNSIERRTQEKAEELEWQKIK